MTLTAPIPSKSKNTALLVLGIVIVVIVVAGILLSAYVPRSPLFVGPRPQTVTIVNGQLNLQTTYYAANFTVPNGAQQIKVNITFTAQGGSGNDIKFFAFAREQFFNWANHKSYLAIRETGQITSLNEEISLPSSGSYSLVYDNSYSFFSTKTVQARATLTYLL